MQKFESTTFTAKISCPHTDVQLVRCGTVLTVTLTYQGAYGMGEKYDALNQKGRVVVNQVEEKFCFQGTKTYCPAPFFWTDTGFGLYVDTCETTTFRFDEDSVTIDLPKTASVMTFAGEPQQIISEYMQLFGKAVLPPEWAFGVWISANRWNCQKDAEQQIENLKTYDFPASVLVLEAWSDEATFYIWNGAKYQPKPDGGVFGYDEFDFSGSPWPDPKGMTRALHDAGLHLVLWQIPVYKKQGSDEIMNVQNTLDHEDAVQRGLCVHLADGSPYTIPDGHWFSGSMIPDYTNPETVQTWFAKRQYLLDMGVDGFKTDGGEFIYRPDVRFMDGNDGKSGKNCYARDYTCAYRDFIGSQRVLFSRAGFSGQHTVPIHWGGDQQSQNTELRSQLCAGLSAAASGILFWGFDLAGFAGPLPTLDLYRRATQMACFCPIMQWHSEPDGGQFKELMPGAVGNNERSPWNMAAAYNAPKFVDEMRFWHKLRERLRPYLWETAQRCVADNMPMMRPLAFLWPEDEAALACEDEYMLGDALLVAPLLEESAESRQVYLPEGEWTGFFDRKPYHGKQMICTDCDGKIPVFIRSGYEKQF